MRKLKPKPVAESAIDYFPYKIRPQDLNAHRTVFGGLVLSLADSVAGDVAERHSGKICVTLGVDSVRFLAPAQRGETLVFQAAVNRVWNTSLEVGVKVLAIHHQKRTRRHVLSAYFTFVAIGASRKPIKVPQAIPQGGEEKRRYREADERRKMRLSSTPA